MRIRITDNVLVDVVVTQTTRCPAGTAYWIVQYCIDDLPIYTVHTAAIYGQPDAIAILDQDHERRRLSDGARVAETRTHREWLIGVLDQIESESIKI